MKSVLEQEKKISPGDLDLFVMTDDPQEVVRRILEYVPPEEKPPTLA
jgi:predicted Rossmann-fold nucleotide-binding protein